MLWFRGQRLSVRIGFPWQKKVEYVMRSKTFLYDYSFTDNQLERSQKCSRSTSAHTILAYVVVERSKVKRSYWSSMAKKGGICYALISRSKTVLCDYNFTDNQFESSCLTVLDNVTLDSCKDKFSYDTGEYLFHAYVSSSLIFLCVTEITFDRNVAFNCLFELERQLILTGLKERAEIAGPYALRSPFSATMASVMSQHSSNDALRQLESKVEDVTGIMRKNIDKAIHRGETLNDLNERSEYLADSSTEFRQSATKLKRRLFWKSIKRWAIVIIILLVIVGIIIGILFLVLAAKGAFKHK